MKTSPLWIHSSMVQYYCILSCQFHLFWVTLCLTWLCCLLCLKLENLFTWFRLIKLEAVMLWNLKVAKDQFPSLWSLILICPSEVGQYPRLLGMSWVQNHVQWCNWCVQCCHQKSSFLSLVPFLYSNNTPMHH